MSLTLANSPTSDQVGVGRACVHSHRQAAELARARSARDGTCDGREGGGREEGRMDEVKEDEELTAEEDSSPEEERLL